MKELLNRILVKLNQLLRPAIYCLLSFLIGALIMVVTAQRAIKASDDNAIACGVMNFKLQTQIFELIMAYKGLQDQCEGNKETF